MDVEPKIGGFYPQNGWFIMENLIKMDDLGVALFLETPISRSFWSKRPKPPVGHPLHGEKYGNPLLLLVQV